MVETTAKPMTAQRKWQLRMRAEHRCISCAKPCNLYKNHCDSCHMARVAFARRYTNYQAWHPGGKGRVPNWYKAKQAAVQQQPVEAPGAEN